MVAGLALGAFLLIDTAVGLRLLWTGARRSDGPAWACGLGFVCIGLLGYPLATLAGVGAAPVGELDHGLGAAGTVFTAVGLSAFYVFTLLAFRRRAVWAWCLTGGATALLLFAAFGQIGALATADPSLPSADAAEGFFRITGILSTLCYAWTGYEGLSEWRRAKRREALGLVDPLVVNRIFLWGLHGVAVTGLTVLMMALHFQSVHVVESPLVQVAMAAISLISGVAITLAFFPTSAWSNFVRRHAALAES